MCWTASGKAEGDLNDGKTTAALDRGGASPPSGVVVSSRHNLCDDNLEESVQLANDAGLRVLHKKGSQMGSDVKCCWSAWDVMR